MIVILVAAQEENYGSLGTNIPDDANYSGLVILYLMRQEYADARDYYSRYSSHGDTMVKPWKWYAYAFCRFFHFYNILLALKFSRIKDTSRDKFLLYISLLK